MVPCDYNGIWLGNETPPQLIWEDHRCARSREHSHGRMTVKVWPRLSLEVIEIEFSSLHGLTHRAPDGGSQGSQGPSLRYDQGKTAWRCTRECVSL